RAFASSITSQASAIAEIPPCGIQCLFTAIPTSGCLWDDVSCICQSENLTRAMATCLLDNCTMADTQNTARVQADLCHLSKDSKRTEMFLFSGILYAIGLMNVMLRTAGKLVSKRLAWDDWILVGTLLFTTLPLGCVLAMTRIGFGEHLWNLKANTLLPILRYFYIAWSTYILVITLIKIALVVFYLEIFDSRRFKITAYIVIVYLVVTSLISFFITIFVCKPISYYWNRDIEGTCMDPQVIAYGCSVCAIVQDVVLLILPLVFIRDLKIQRRRKIGAVVMFSVGSLGCIATIIRFHALTTFRISVDPTWDYVSATIWTEVELAAGSICVSLPSIRVLVSKTL
ncbi:hypothetical protein COCMIDRAFT_65711, partial [Bipolaris oryzae ATCC 44560]